MSEELEIDRIRLMRIVHTVINQEIPVSETSPVHMLFLGRKIAATKYLSERLSESGQEELMHYIWHCNEQIKKYLGL